jgi:gas vesicle protein
MSEWAGLVGTLAGTAIGGAIAYFIARQQHGHELRLDLTYKYI